MKVYLDDQRPAPVGWTRAYWPDEVIRLLRSRKVKVLSLDHDLGDDQRGTGYDVITWIEQEVALGRFTPPLILVHSANPVAAQRTRAGIESISKLLDGMSLSQGSTLKAYEIYAHGRKVLMEDLELLSRLEGHQAFGVSMVQRISGFGYQRALDTIARLEAEGAILRDDASSQWMLDNTRARLHALYHTHKSTVRELEDFPRAGVEPLILMDVPKGWSKATNRVLIVGQETLGWDFEPGDYYEWPYPAIKGIEDFLDVPNSVEAMIHGYRAFQFSRYQPGNVNSPFWRAYRQIREAVGDEPEGFETKVLYTNLFKTAVNGTSIVKNGTTQEADDIWRASAQLLTREIEILRPDAVVFFTGPDYDRYLELEFPNLEWASVNGHDQRQLSKVIHSSLPSKAYRTYHPGYLSRGNWHLVDQVCSALV
ncbi:cyclic-phosphate processing receiver domain-containing protein [Pseudomonas veronii]|uniref:cyclic-phosphate processing receiver domain-containing protein n=1 Tax=Pseudomonas veronii TaxID=76761 RepID=UPI002D779218|nr:cyclic-phosphate processing receiver domain-containing protein [Pseudomonas veronii]WRU61311.1 cyclic-phosphate processing receiver domain-containing protein [Pseudomonas veronii]